MNRIRGRGDATVSRSWKPTGSGERDHRQVFRKYSRRVRSRSVAGAQIIRSQSGTLGLFHKSKVYRPILRIGGAREGLWWHYSFFVRSCLASAGDSLFRAVVAAIPKTPCIRTSLMRQESHRRAADTPCPRAGKRAEIGRLICTSGTQVPAQGARKQLVMVSLRGRVSACVRLSGTRHFCLRFNKLAVR